MRTLAWLLSLPFRAVGYLAVVGALFTGFWDLYQSVSQDRMVLTPLGQFWSEISPGTLNLTQAVIQRYVHPGVWEHGVFWFLKLPGFTALLIFATVVLLVAQLIYRPMNSYAPRRR